MMTLCMTFLSSSRRQSTHSFPALWWTSSHSSTRALRSSGSWNAQTPTSLPTTWGDLRRWPWPSLYLPFINHHHTHSLVTGLSSNSLCGGLQVKPGITPFSFVSRVDRWVCFSTVLGLRGSFVAYCEILLHFHSKMSDMTSQARFLWEELRVPSPFLFCFLRPSGRCWCSMQTFYQRTSLLIAQRRKWWGSDPGI